MGTLWLKGISYDTSAQNLDVTWSKYNGNKNQWGTGDSYGGSGDAYPLGNSNCDGYPQYRVVDYISGRAYPVRVDYKTGAWNIGWYKLDVLPTAYITVNFNNGVGNRTYTWNGTSSVGNFPSTSKTGYTHSGWKIGSTTYSATSNVTSDWVSSYRTSGTISATAQWTANQYTITFNANQGSGGPSTQTKTYDSTLTLSSTKPTRAGYDFLYWNTKSDGTGTTYYAGGSFSTNITSNITLYAIWKASTSDILTATDITLSLTNSVNSTITWKPNESTFKFKIKA